MDAVNSPPLHPASLPPGTRVCTWRVESWRGRGASGTVYRAVPIGQEHAEPVALKLAVNPREPRFEREAALLSRLDHPHVPTLHASGQWQPEDRAYPYLVMQWVEGTPLYDWAEARNPTSRQVLRVLAQLARALEATHAAGGIHRDVKGANILVRGDGHAFLTDFGASTHAGASLLTSEPLPPGTPAYRSPEAWNFARRCGHQRGAHYDAQPSDDLFALGVTAYRLVTAVHPPPTDPRAEESLFWYVGRASPCPPRKLNPRVDSHLDALILRMLHLRPEERGTVGALAEALEQRAERAGSKADQPLFTWETPHRHRPRHSPREEAHAVEPAPRHWARLAVLLLSVGLWRAHPSPPEAPPPDERHVEDAATIELAREVLTAPKQETAPPRTSSNISLEMPHKPLPGQRRPDNRGKCRYRGEVALNGGCWLEAAEAELPCAESEYHWKGKCYLPVYTEPKPPTSSPPSHP